MYNGWMILQSNNIKTDITEAALFGGEAKQDAYKHTHKCNHRRSHVQYTVPYDNIQYTSLWNKIYLKSFQWVSCFTLGSVRGSDSQQTP